MIQEDEEISLTQKGTSSEVEVGLRYTLTYATLINFGIAQSFGKKIKVVQNFSLLIDSKNLVAFWPLNLLIFIDLAVNLL